MLLIRRSITHHYDPQYHFASPQEVMEEVGCAEAGRYESFLPSGILCYHRTGTGASCHVNIRIERNRNRV